MGSRLVSPSFGTNWQLLQQDLGRIYFLQMTRPTKYHIYAITTVVSTLSMLWLRIRGRIMQELRVDRPGWFEGQMEVFFILVYIELGELASAFCQELRLRTVATTKVWPMEYLRFVRIFLVNVLSAQAYDVWYLQDVMLFDYYNNSKQCNHQ